MAKLNTRHHPLRKCRGALSKLKKSKGQPISKMLWVNTMRGKDTLQSSYHKSTTGHITQLLSVLCLYAQISRLAVLPGASSFRLLNLCDTGWRIYSTLQLHGTQHKLTRDNASAACLQIHEVFLAAQLGDGTTYIFLTARLTAHGARLTARLTLPRYRQDTYGSTEKSPRK